MNQLAQFAVTAPDRMDWNGSASGIRDVSRRLKEMFAIHLGRVISKVSPISGLIADVDGLSICL